VAEDHYARAAKYYLDGFNELSMLELDIALTSRPSYLEALRLKERIITETSPEGTDALERNMIDKLEEQDQDMWLRR